MGREKYHEAKVRLREVIWSKYKKQAARKPVKRRKFRLCMFVCYHKNLPGRVAQSVGHLTRKSGVLGSIPGLATYFRFSFRFFMKGSCQLLAKVCARSTG